MNTNGIVNWKNHNIVIEDSFGFLKKMIVKGINRNKNENPLNIRIVKFIVYSCPREK
jgi:hypothetical protein